MQMMIMLKFFCSIFRNLENGILDRVKEKMLPEMPKCTENSCFNSASLVDVYTAFGILFVGMIISLGLCILERLWNKRTIVQEKIIRSIHVHRKDNHRHSEHVEHHRSSHIRWPLQKSPTGLATISNHLETNVQLTDSQAQLSRRRKKIQQNDMLNYEGNPDANLIIPFRL
ncbi:uncharacterized protein LOC122509226 [Leptopilina heterotoma]|uniref:uncharacterized protein LOC122509226 n=1 Tax=Leptopilina heterotoma TaxID=63436 RepID=UPI001CAA02BC|nr:uncharacterized protein LOC122509226 [Leptopilina heterotoma]